MRSIAFFNNKGGVGKTTLVYHIAWMFAAKRYKTLMVDLDPQANLSAIALSEDRLGDLWSKGATVFGAVSPIFEGIGDVWPAHIEHLSDDLSLLVGDLTLSRIEDDMSAQWPRCLEGKERALRVTSVFHRVIEEAAQRSGAQVVLIDVSPSLGALNRAALLAATDIVVPAVPDLFSVCGVQNLGPTLRHWSETWQYALRAAPSSLKNLPTGQWSYAGYVLLRRHSQQTAEQLEWEKKLEVVYKENVAENGQIQTVGYYPGLMLLAMQKKIPMFRLDESLKDVIQCCSEFDDLVSALTRQIKLV